MRSFPLLSPEVGMRPLLCTLFSLALVTALTAEEPKKKEAPWTYHAFVFEKGTVIVRERGASDHIEFDIKGADRNTPVDVSDDGRFLALALEMDILIFDVKTKKQVHEIPFPKASFADFDMEKGYLSALSTETGDMQMKLWKVPAPGEKIEPLVPDPKASKKVVFKGDKTVEIVDRYKGKDGKRQRVSVAVEGKVVALETDDNERFFALAFADRVTVHHLGTGQVLATVPVKGVTLLSFHEKTGVLVGVDPTLPVEEAFKDLWRFRPK